VLGPEVTMTDEGISFGGHCRERPVGETLGMSGGWDGGGRLAVVGDVAEVEARFGVRVAGTGHELAEERLLGQGLVWYMVLVGWEGYHDAACIADYSMRR